MTMVITAYITLWEYGYNSRSRVIKESAFKLSVINLFASAQTGCWNFMGFSLPE
jgi:hypothetical protein